MWFVTSWWATLEDTTEDTCFILIMNVIWFCDLFSLQLFRNTNVFGIKFYKALHHCFGHRLNESWLLKHLREFLDRHWCLWLTRWVVWKTFSLTNQLCKRMRCEKHSTNKLIFNSGNRHWYAWLTEKLCSLAKAHYGP